MRAKLLAGAAHFKLTLSPAQLDAFDSYLHELIAWNQRANLTSITEPGEVLTKHFLDSLSVFTALAELPATISLIDVGSGAGFPGLPLKIALPQLQLTLLEATAKKTAFLHHLVAILNLPEVTIVTARAEEAGQRAQQRERYDVAVARAVAALPVLAEYTLPLVKVGGRVIIQKGQYPLEEINQAGRAIETLGGQLVQTVAVTIPGLNAERHLVVIQKNKATPKQYPRRPGLPAQKPI